MGTIPRHPVDTLPALSPIWRFLPHGRAVAGFLWGNTCDGEGATLRRVPRPVSGDFAFS